MLSVGNTIEVVVKTVNDGFAIVEYQGVTATLVDIELTYEVGSIVKVSDFVSVGEKHTVKITAVDGDRYSVSLKQMNKNPWLNPPKVGEKYNAPITMVTDYGYFIKIEWFCLGLLLNENAKAIHAQGETVSVVITRSEAEKKRVFLNEL